MGTGSLPGLGISAHGTHHVIDARVLDVRPHPCQATNNPGCWAVQFEVSRAGRTRTFWRWHNVREDRQLEGGGSIYVRPSNREPTHDEILAGFWNDTFANLHGFSFNKESP